MSKLNIKGISLRNLEWVIGKELNSKLPIKERSIKKFLLDVSKSYRLTKTKEGLDLNEPEGRYFSIMYQCSPLEVGIDIGKALRYMVELSEGKQIETVTDKNGEAYKITLVNKKGKQYKIK